MHDIHNHGKNLEQHFKLANFRFHVDLACFIDTDIDGDLDEVDVIVDGDGRETINLIDDDDVDGDVSEEGTLRERRDADSVGGETNPRKLMRSERRRLNKLARKAARQERVENNFVKHTRLAAKEERQEARKTKKLQRQQMRIKQMADKMARNTTLRAQRQENKVVYMSVLLTCQKLSCCPFSNFLLKLLCVYIFEIN